MKNFDLEAAKNGAPVCTRSGREARIVCFDYKNRSSMYPIVALVKIGDNEEIGTYGTNGRLKYGHKNQVDLMMKTTRKTGWVGIFKNPCVTTVAGCSNIYPTKEKAEKALSGEEDIIDIVEVGWEE